MIIEDIQNHEGDLLHTKKIFAKPKQNIYVLYYVKIDPINYMNMLNW